MSPEMTVLIAPLAFGIAAGMTIERFRSKMRRDAWRNRNRSRWGSETRATKTSKVSLVPGSGPSPSRPLDAADQLRIVMGAAFTIQPLLNKSEARVLKELERFVDDCNPRWQVMAQVSLGEVLRSKDLNAFACINSKRVDLLLVDDDCLPRHAIEYQGSGHHLGSAAARDAVKKEALRRAGIGYHEVVAGQTTPSELRRLVEKLVARPTSVQPDHSSSTPSVSVGRGRA